MGMGNTKLPLIWNGGVEFSYREHSLSISNSLMPYRCKIWKSQLTNDGIYDRSCVGNRG
jgi:hypothetical protein